MAEKMATFVAALKLSREGIRGFERVSPSYDGCIVNANTGQYNISFFGAYFPHCLIGLSDQWSSMKLVW